MKQGDRNEVEAAVQAAKDGSASEGKDLNAKDPPALTPAASGRFVYRDFSQIPPDDGESVLDAIANVGPSNIKHQKLPVKLDAMLSDDDFSHIISWMPHGRSWRILKPKAFVKEVLPKYFDYCNYNSFIRLVNAWGFRRFTSGPDRHSYYHELFLRGLPHLHSKMRRVAGKEKKPPVDQEDEPDLYSISQVHPLPQTGGGGTAQRTAQGVTATPNVALPSAVTTSQLSSLPIQALSSGLLQDKSPSQLLKNPLTGVETKEVGQEASTDANNVLNLKQNQWSAFNLAALSQVQKEHQQRLTQQITAQQQLSLQQLSAQQLMSYAAAAAVASPPQMAPVLPAPTPAQPVTPGNANDLTVMYIPVYTSKAAAAATVSGAPMPAMPPCNGAINIGNGIMLPQPTQPATQSAVQQMLYR